MSVALRHVLLDPAEVVEMEVTGESPAAVLVPLYLQDGELHAVFTRRRDDLRHHPGQISFPGGRHDAADLDLQVTALREAEEEIGLRASSVELLGGLPPTTTARSLFAVYPFVGLIERASRWRPSATEVAEVIELPLTRLRSARRVADLPVPGRRLRGVVYEVADVQIWGATARILGDLLLRVPDELA